jgi:RHS repeat-associated protein
VTFQPLLDEAGEYGVTAGDPGVTNPSVQAQFEIVGMTASPATGNVTIVPSTQLTGDFTLTNLSDVPLTGLSATWSGGPAGLIVQLTTPGQIAGDGTATLGYSLDDASTQAATGVVTIQITTTQGAVLSILLEVSVAPLVPVLAANPAYLDSGMVVGDQSLLSFTITNNGGSPSGALTVSLPETSYMTLASPATIPSLAPGASSTVTVELTPPADLPLEEYTGSIGISGTGTGISVPFTFIATTTATGTVTILVDDNYTFEEAGSPRVQGATVNLLNPYDNTDVVETGTTDASGAVTLANVPAGPYDLQVTAPGHSSYDNSFTVVPGITNGDEVFIAEQFVTYTWDVVQTSIQDTYQIQLQTTFATDVPAPVLTISAPSSIPTLVPGQSWTFNAVITNHGLIAAQGVTLNLPTDLQYTFTALSTDIGVVPADSSVTVPVTVTYVAPQSISVSDGGTQVTASVVIPSPVQSDVASTVYVDYTNTGTVAVPAPILALTATQGSSQGAFLSLDSSLAGLAYNSNVTPAGFSDTVQFLASGATPGMLEPGESETIPVYYAGWLSSQWTGASVTFSLSEVGTNDTEPIDWPSVAPGLELGSINEAAWNAITPILAANMGSTWGQYVQTLDNDAAYLAGIGEPTTDLSQLLSFEIEKANAGYFVQTLTSVTVDDLPAPGMDLTFTQSYQASISGRYSRGILGLGWSTNWDISATTVTNGDVVIENDGIFAYFSLQPNGSYAPEAGDEGMTLTESGGAYQLVDPDSTIYQFNANGTLAYVQDTHGNTITAGYNGLGQLVSLTDSNGEYLDLSYDSQGDLATLTDSNGQTETYGYDPTGEFLTSYTDVYGTTTYTYLTGQSAAQSNALGTITNAAGTQTFFTYDSDGRLIDEHENTGAEDEAIGYLSPGGYTTTDGDGNKTTVYFNLYGAPAVTIDPLGNVTRDYYDSNLDLTEVAGPGGSTYTYTYDANGNLTSETDPLGLTTTFTYNAANDLTSYTDASGNTTSYSYDSQDDLLSITYADGTQQSYTYNPLGEATSFLNADGDAIGYTYNAQGLVATETFADGTSYLYTYNAQGNMTSATDAQGNVETFLYGDSSNPDVLTEVEYPDDTWLQFSYNIIGQRTQSVDQTGFTVNYAYDSLGRLSELTDGNGNLIVLYTYGNAGNLIQKDNGNGTFTLYTYDADDDVLSITNYAPSTGGTNFVVAYSAVNSFDDYTYDALGNILTDTNQDGEWVYAYDADSQLIQAIFTPNSTDPDGLTAQNLQYVYDAAGNRVSETVNGVITTYVVNNVNEYASSTTNGVATTYQYDADGNLIAQSVGGSTTTYTYNELNELTTVNGTGLAASYGYDPLGNLVSQTFNGATINYQIDPAGLGNVVATFSGTGALTAHYAYGLGLVSQVSATGATAYYDLNNIGSVVGMTGTSGSYVNLYAYLPFGQTMTVAAAVSNPFTFVGQLGAMSAADGLYAMRNRLYDSAVGRFVQRDPLNVDGGSANLTTYAANNPVLETDPTGLGPGLGDVTNFIQGDCVRKAEVVGNVLGKWIGEKLGEGAGLTIDGAIVLFAAGETVTVETETVGGATIVVAQVDSWFIRVTIPFFFDVGEYFGGEFGGRFGEWLGGQIGELVCPCKCPPQKPPKPPGGPCTLVIGGSYYYICLNNQIYSGFVAPIVIPGRPCGAQAVAGALASIEGGAVGGVALIPPGVVSVENCNPLINPILQQTQQTSTDATGATADTAPAIGDTDDDTDDDDDDDSSLLAFLEGALGQLGLDCVPPTNYGNTAPYLAEMVPTIATFDQVEADLAGIFTTAAGQGASLGISGDLALLQEVDDRLEAVTNAESLLFGGDADWLDTNQTSTLQQWMMDFLMDAGGCAGDVAVEISSEDTAALLATPLPSSVSTSEAQEFINRYNLSVQYWSQGIFTASQVPAGDSTDFLDLGALQTAFNAAELAEQESQVDGYADVGAEAQGALAQVVNDLEGQGVCATIQLQIDQSATLTRSAFSGTLTIDNSEGTGPMTNVTMDINITDAQGNPANGEFYVSSPTYSGAFSVVNGIATLPDYSTGSISFTFIPDDSAAPSAPTQYMIGGTIGFTDPAGGAVTIPVFPSTITVYPQAELELNYFLQTDVVGQDPFSSQVQPSEPAVLGLLVTNVGGETANNLSITTAQPQIVQNEKGLLDTFQIIGTQVGNQQETPSLTVDLGDIAPGQTADASFLIESQLAGEFVNFSATFSHSDALGGTETSLIQSVTTHSLVYAGDFNYPDSTGATDYLVDDTPNPEGLPDTVYFSDGMTAPVNIATDATAAPYGSGGDLTYQVTANVSSGWDYIQLPDPGSGYTLYQVVRSDGTVIPVNDQAWQTNESISPTGVTSVDYELHILDYDSTGSYLVYYRPTTATAPTVASISSISSPQAGSISSVDVAFSEPIDPSTFTAANLSLTLNGGANLINSDVTITQDSPTTFTIGGLSSHTTGDGNYTFTVSAAGITDFFGDEGTGSLSTEWATGVNVPVIVSVGAGSPSLVNTPVDTVDVVLSEAIEPASFDYNALSLTLNGGSNLITSGVTVTEINATTYQIGGLAGLTAANGEYVLTVSAAGLVDASGNTGVGFLSDTWSMNTVGPTIASIPTYIQSPRNIVVPSIDVIFSEPIVPSSFTYQDITYSNDGGPNLILPTITITEISPTEFQVTNFNNFLLPIDGTYTFTVSAGGVMDLYGNTGTGSASATWELITTPPAAPTDLAISPNEGGSPVLTGTGSVTLTGTLSESGPLDDSGLTVDVFDGNTNLGYATVDRNSFSMALNLPAGANDLEVTVTDAAGNVSPAATLNVLVDESPVQITSVAAPMPNPTNAPVASIDVTFTEPINLSTFSAANLMLTDNGEPNLITSAVTISLVSGSTYEIGGLAGLTTAEGTYKLTVNAAGIQDAAGNVGAGSMSTTWLMDTTPPTSMVETLPSQTTSTAFPVSVSGTDPSGANGSMPSGIASFAIYVSTNGGAFTYWTTVTPANPTVEFAGQAGNTYGFYSVATDNAGNVQPTPTAAQQSVQILFPMSVTSITPASPNPTDTPVSSLNATFSVPVGAINFTTAALTLTDNGGPNLITNGVSLTPVQGTTSTYTITGLGGLSMAEGTYVLTVDAAAIDDIYGNPGTSTLSTSWLMDTTPPVSTVNPLPPQTMSTSFTVSVTAYDPSGANGSMPSGVASIAIYDSTNGGPFTLFATVTPADPSATFTGLPGNTYGFYSIATDDAGNVEATPSATEATTEIVTSTTVNTTTTLQSSEDPSQFGGQVTFTATVTPAQTTNGVPTGSVQFSIDGNAVGNPVTLDDNGDATFTASMLSVGSHTVTVSYINADDNFNPSSGTLTGGQTVSTADTTISVDSSDPTAVYGQMITFTVTVAAVTPGLPLPTETVELFDGSNDLGSAILDDGSATFQVSTLALGSHSITAQYLGDGNFSASMSTVLSQVVNQDGTTAAITSSSNPSVLGQSVSFTVTVSAAAPGSRTPTGTVQFELNGNDFGSPVTLVDGTATSASTHTLGLGTYTITASYSGDTDFLSSTAPSLSQIVQPDSSTTSVASQTNPSVYGQAVTFTATVQVVAPGTVKPTGTVSFMNGSTTLDTVTLSDGGATFTTKSLPVGADSITAVYNGTASIMTSTSAMLTQTVNQDATTTSVTSSRNPSVYGESVAFAAAVKAAAPGGGTPTGTVTFMDGTTPLGSVTLSDGRASFKTNQLDAGSHSITVVYNGDANFLTSTSAPLDQTVEQARTTTTLTSSLNPTSYGEEVTFTATVKAKSPGSGTPTGTVTFMDGSNVLGMGTLSDGVAMFSTTTLSVGTHSITAVYSGDDNFTTSTSPVLKQKVKQSTDAANDVVSTIDPSGVVQSLIATATHDGVLTASASAASAQGAPRPTGISSGGLQAPVVDLAIGTIQDDGAGASSALDELAVDLIVLRSRRRVR